MDCTFCQGSHPADSPCDTRLAFASAREEESDEDDALIGAEIGSFRVVRTLGRGGMGTVYLGEHQAIGSKVAIKVLHPHLSLDPVMVARFQDEARATIRIGHENIVSIFDFGQLPPHRYYLVMEYLEGSPLAAHLARPMPPEKAVPLLVQACAALEAAHRCGVVHRDLKPENLFLVRRGLGDFVKVLDFGIAKLLGGDRSETHAGVVLGTPEFMAPEQIAGDGVDGRADQYALGVIAYRLLTGRLPFSGGWAKVMLAHQSEAPRPPREILPSLPEGVSAAVLHALGKQPEDRFESAAAFGEALLRGLASTPMPSPAWRAADAPPATTAPLRPAEPSTPTSAVTPAATPPPRGTASTRAPQRYRAQLIASSGGPVRVELVDLTRAGAFVRGTSGFPALRERVRLGIELPGGVLRAKAEVVRHIPPDQAAQWNMPAGYALQFVETGPGFAQTLCAWMSARASPAQGGERVEALLRDFRSRLKGDPYALLGVAPDAEFPTLRRAVQRLLAQFEPLLDLPLDAVQKEHLSQLRDKVNQAGLTLGDPVRRSEHDASRGNFRGVARCIAAGMTASDLESCRRRFLAQRPHAQGASHVHLTSGRAWEAQGNAAAALREYERGLERDPLHLELQRRYWALRRASAHEAA